MKIGFVTSVLNDQNQKRGIGIYAQNLLEALKKGANLEIVEIKSTDDKKDLDIIHYPSFDLFKPTLPLKKKFPTVVTIHDTTPLLFPKYYPPGIKGKISLLRQKLSLKNTKAIITDSNHSKKDIIKYLAVPESKIFPVHLSFSDAYKKISDKDLLSKVKQKYKLPDSFVLYVGDINWNKNLVNIAKATKIANVDLVLVGSNFMHNQNLNHPELAGFRQFQEEIKDSTLFHQLGFVDLSDLVLIMNQARILLMPSLYEGFGLPILEAQACGLVVITSNTSSMPEIAGEGAILVSPSDPKDIASAITKVISSESLSKKLASLGLENIKRFSWQKTAEETIEVYKYVLNS